MINFSVIQKFQLEGALRLDAEYYQLEYLHAANKLMTNNIQKLENLSLSVKKGIFDLNPDNYKQIGVPFIRTTEINDPLIDFSSTVFLDEVVHQRNKSTILQSGDFVFTKIGANIGCIAILPNNYYQYNFSQNVAGIRIRRNLIDSGYLLAFLLSKFGKFQIERSQMISGQSKLELKDIREFKIVIPSREFQNIIGHIISQAQMIRDESLMLYKQAENLLLGELGLKDFQIEDDLSFVVNLSDVQSANRVDAEYFQLKYERLLKQIRLKNGKNLGDLVTMKKGFEPGSEAYQEEGKLFIRVSNLSRFGIEDKDQKYLSNDLYQKLISDFEPKIGEILLTKDATPGVAYVIKESVEGIIAGGILRLQLKQKVEPEYLALCINSLVGRLQVERDAGGSVIAHWRPDQIKDILIPILPNSTQQKIADLVRKSHEARRKSKELLEKAKREVEEMIEIGVKQV